MLEPPKTGMKIELEILHGPYASSYASHVVGVDERSVTVVHPMVGGKLVLLAPGDEVRAEYAIKNAARLSFMTRVIDLDTRVLPVVLLAPPQEDQVVRYQQRDFYRLDTNLPLTYHVRYLPSDEPRPTRLFHSVTRDVSGNGAQILCPESYPLGTHLDIQLEVDGLKVNVLGEVVRHVQTMSAREHWMGIRFLRLEERDRDLIIRYIFNQQRDRRRKGLL